MVCQIQTRRMGITAETPSGVPKTLPTWADEAGSSCLRLGKSEIMTNETNAVETMEAPATAVAKKVTKKATKKAVAKKATKKTVKKGAKKESTPRGPSIRSKVFALLKKHANGLTGPQIQEKLELQGVPALLKDEAIGEKNRIKRTTVEGVRGVVYVLTALGKKHADAGAETVDEFAAPKAAGMDWPSNR